MTLCKKGGESEKYQIMNILLRSDILLGEGGWSKPMSFFQNVFQLIICQFYSSSCYIFSSIFNIIAVFFRIFDTNNNFIIDCCRNGMVWVKEIGKNACNIVDMQMIDTGSGPIVFLLTLFRSGGYQIDTCLPFSLYWLHGFRSESEQPYQNRVNWHLCLKSGNTKQPVL